MLGLSLFWSDVDSFSGASFMSNLARCSVIAEVDRSRGLGSPLVQMSYIDILYSHASYNALLVLIISADFHRKIIVRSAVRLRSRVGT